MVCVCAKQRWCGDDAALERSYSAFALSCLVYGTDDVRVVSSYRNMVYTTRSSRE